MKVENVLIQPPSLVAQLEGKVNEAFRKMSKEELVQFQENQKASDSEKAQQAIDLLA